MKYGVWALGIVDQKVPIIWENVPYEYWLKRKEMLRMNNSYREESTSNEMWCLSSRNIFWQEWHWCMMVPSNHGNVWTRSHFNWWLLFDRWSMNFYEIDWLLYFDLNWWPLNFAIWCTTNNKSLKTPQITFLIWL